jgi:hypothetical protein
MRASRRTVVVLLLGAALAVAPSSLSASASGSRARPALGVLEQAWQLVGRVAGWFGGFRVDEGGGSLDPNGKANHGRIHPASGRPAPGVSPDEGGSLDPNG